MGEAHFFRAYYYYYLLQHYGGMPIFRSSVTASDFGSIPRSSYSETMQFIIDELKEAEELLPNREEYGSSDLGRASKGAARGMLARVMLYRLGTDAECSNTWQDLYDITNSIITSGSYQLVPNTPPCSRKSLTAITEGNHCLNTLVKTEVRMQAWFFLGSSREIEAQPAVGGLTNPPRIW